MDEQAAAPSINRVRVKAVALPAEHGGWGFLLEPILLGLLVAPSWGGVFLAISALAAFLTRHPLRLALTDWQRGRRYTRTAMAERFVLLYLTTALLALVAAILAAGPVILLPLALTTPLAAIQLLYDAQNRGRHWLPETAGPTALAASGTSIALAGGWPMGPALALWIVMAARAIPAVLYVRARLRLEKGQRPALAPALLGHLVSVGLVLVLVWAGLAPYLAVLAMVILLVRAAYGLSKYRRSVAPKVIGFQEMGFGAMTAILTALGFMLKL